MACTDSLLIHPAPGANATVEFSGDVNELIDRIRDVLIAAGWALIENVFASGYVYVPGWQAVYRPTETWERLDAGDTYTRTVNDDPCCGGNCPGDQFFGIRDETHFGCWNIGRQSDCMPEHPPGTGFAHFTGTFATFATRLFACSNIYTSVPAPDGINAFVQANQGGTVGNHPYIRTNIGVGLSDGYSPDVAGGGYRLRSGLANGRTQYDVTLTALRGTGALSIKVTELLHDTSCVHLLMGASGVFFNNGSGVPGAQYKIIADRYQLCIMQVGEPDHLGNFNRGGNSFLSSAPWSDNAAINYGVVVIGPGMLMNSTIWGGFPCSMAINGPFQTYNPGVNPPYSTLAGMAVRTFPYSQPLLTTGLLPIISSAWLMASPSPYEHAAIIGKLWNAFVVSAPYPTGSIFRYGSSDYQQISRQAVAPQSGLWLDLGQFDVQED
jgi:hypothetical protein